MSRKLPFEEIFKRKMNDLPLPDEDNAWQQMQELLDKEDKRRPFAFFKSSRTWMSMALLLLLCFWLMISPEKINKQARITATKQAGTNKQDMQPGAAAGTTANNQPAESNQDSSYVSIQVNADKRIVSVDSSTAFKRSKLTDSLNKQFVSGKRYSPVTNSNEVRLVEQDRLKWKNANVNSGNPNGVLADATNHTQDTANSPNTFNIPGNINKNDTTSIFINGDDSSTINSAITDTLQHTTNNALAATAKTLITIKKHSAFFINAGIGLKQQIPISGQQFVGYNYNGTKTVLTDYIPAAYIQLGKEGRWFLQGEFSYTSPRLINAFTYQQQTKADYSHGSTEVTAYRLQKTFYNEVPVSFNLYVRPHWFVGAGATYSWLRGAVANKETIIYDAQAGLRATTTERIPIKGFTDSFLYKTQTSLLLQTGYEKSRWSFRLQYIHDLQPFITFISPNGIKNNKKNSSLQLMIGYRLFHLSKVKQ